MDTLPDLILASLLSLLDLPTGLSLMRTCSGYYSAYCDLAPPLYARMVPLLHKRSCVAVLNQLCGLGKKGTKEEIECCLPVTRTIHTSTHDVPIIAVNCTGHPKAGLATFILRWLKGQFYSDHQGIEFHPQGTYPLVFAVSQGRVLLLLYTEKDYQCEVPDATIFFLAPNTTPSEAEEKRFQGQKVVWCHSYIDVHGRLSSKVCAEMDHLLQSNSDFRSFQVSSVTGYDFGRPFITTIRWKLGKDTAVRGAYGLSKLLLD